MFAARIVRAGRLYYLGSVATREAARRLQHAASLLLSKGIEPHTVSTRRNYHAPDPDTDELVAFYAARPTVPDAAQCLDLRIAVALDAIAIVKGQACATDAERADAIAWVEGLTDCDPVMRFDSICEDLGIDADAARRALSPWIPACPVDPEWTADDDACAA